MPGLSDFIPLVTEDIDAIRARMDTDANAGVSPTDADYLDTVEGGFYWDVTQGSGLEAERLWDFLGTEVPAVMFITTAWGAYLDEHGAVLGVPRKDEVRATGAVTFTGVAGTPIATGTQVAAISTDPDADPIVFETTEAGTIATTTVTLGVRAVEAGAAGNVPLSRVALLVSPVDGVTSLTNAAAITGGADVETDEPYRDRLLLEFSSTTGGGTIADYERWALAYPGVGHVTVVPASPSPNSVQVIVTDPDNQPVASLVVTGLQGFLDPTPGLGAGQAPVGAAVTVSTPAAVMVTVAAALTFKPGYSLDGSGGTIATRSAITQAMEAYFKSLGPGDDVVHNHVLAQFFRVDGVYNVTSLTLNGATSDITIAPLEVAELDPSLTLS